MEECKNHQVSLGYAYCNNCSTQVYRVHSKTIGSDKRRTLIRQVIEMYGTKCIYCGIQTRPGLSDVHYPNTFTLDHVVPTSHGGTTCIWNTAPACSQCNQSKGDYTLEYWLQDKNHCNHIWCLMRDVFDECHKKHDKTKLKKLKEKNDRSPNFQSGKR